MPVLVYDADEEDFARPVLVGDTLTDDNGYVVATPPRLSLRFLRHYSSLPPFDHRLALPRDAPGPAVAYRTTRRDRKGGLWVQHWLFSTYNSQDRGLLRTGRHEGDWELFQVGLDRERRPTRVTLSQHDGGQRCAWSALRRDPAGRPLVYVANGSHALYPRPGTHPRAFPDPSDEADGRGRTARPTARRFGRWIHWAGHWGASDARALVPGEMDSPRGPAFQPGRWKDPLAFHEAARPCRLDEGAWTRFAWIRYRWAGLVALGLVLGLALRRRGRDRRRRRDAPPPLLASGS